MSSRSQAFRLRPSLLLGLLVLLLNANALSAFFVGDDFDFLRIIRRVDGLGQVAKMQFWGEWEPLWHLSWYVDYRLWGYQPLGYHLTNVFWLAVAVVSAFSLVRMIWPGAPFAAWTTALLFATHPLHDEAVTYLAARGHVMCLAFSLLAVCLYAAARTGRHTQTVRAGLIVGALLALLAAALAKEIAVIVPVWIGTMEWLVLDTERPRPRALLGGLGAGALFLVPAAGSLLLRSWVVGLDSDKLEGLGGDWAELVEDLGDKLGAYTLLGAFPFPFGFMDELQVSRFDLLGWLTLAVAVGAGAAALVIVATRRGTSPGPGVYVLGLAIATSALVPVFWADLPLRRRYLFIPTVGITLMVSVVLEWLRPRAPRIAVGVLAVAVLIGAIGTWRRNALYREAGQVVRNLIETARGARLGEPVAWAEPPRIAWVVLPARYGGDSFSGTYLVHHTDLKSALAIFGPRQREIAYAMRSYHAQDLSSEVLWVDPKDDGAVVVAIRFSFRTRRAFLAALNEDPAERRRGRVVMAQRMAVDEQARTMDYAVRISGRFLDGDSDVLLYGDGVFTSLVPEIAD